MAHAVALEWHWTALGEKQIRIQGPTLIVWDSRSQPDTRTFSLVEAFADARLLFIERPEIFADVMRALATRLDEDQLEVLARRRRAFWLAFDACAPFQLGWSYQRSSEQPPRPVTLEVSEVSALCTAPPPDSYTERKWQLIDDLFFHGPLEPGIPAATRAELVAAILAALKPGSGLDASHAFPEVDHARIEPASWTWDKQEDGESGAAIGGAAVISGYQYGHDFGWSEYSVERVLTGAPEIVVFSAPAEVWAGIVDALRVAVK